MLSAALAASIPDAQQTIDKTADFYLNQGVLGATCVLLLLLLVTCLLIIWRQDARVQRLNAITLRDRERLIEALEGVRNADERDREVLRSLEQTIAARTNLLSELTNQHALTAQEMRHGFGNMSQALGGLVEMLRDLRTTLFGSKKDGGNDRSGGAP